VFWLASSGLIAFCLLFGIPFVSSIAARKVVAWAGCTPPSFDMQAVCPAGSYAEPFVPLSHWFTSGLAPLVLAKNFGGMLATWALLCVVLGLLWFTLSVSRARSN
jgi:hypothetical protein